MSTKMKFFVSFWGTYVLLVNFKDKMSVKSHKTVDLKVFLNFLLVGGRIGSRIQIGSVQIITYPDPRGPKNGTGSGTLQLSYDMLFQELEDQGILDPNQDGGEEDQPHDEILAELERCQSELRSGRTVNQAGRPAAPPPLKSNLSNPGSRILALLIPDLNQDFFLQQRS
jgi:hypothetical protein